MSSGRTVTARTGSVASRLTVLFLLVVFALQGILIQSHIHGQMPGWTQASSASAPVRPDSHDPLDPANCPLCQEMLHAGSFVAPGLIVLPQATVRTFFFVIGADTAKPPSMPDRGWNSRAPPRA